MALVEKSSRFATPDQVEANKDPLDIKEVDTEEAVVDDGPVDTAGALTLDNDSILGGPLRYPVDHQDRYQAFIKFSQYEIIPPDVGDSTMAALGDGISDATNAVAEEADESEGLLDFFGGILGRLGGALADALEGDEEAKDPDAVNGSDPSSDQVITNRRVAGKGDPITLYLPTALTFTDSLQYDTASLGLAGAAGFEAASKGGGAIEALGSAFTQGGKSIMDMFSGSANTGDLARLAMVRGLSAVPGAGKLQEGASIAAGVTLNPNVRASFKGVSIREFTFQFKFIPKSKEESQAVEKIIKRFRFAAYPETLSVDGSVDAGDIESEVSLAAGYKFPDLFDIQVKYKTKSGEVKVGNKFLKCFLKGITTNYNPSTMAFHKDGTPVEIDLTLNFVEEKTIDRRAIMQGY